MNGFARMCIYFLLHIQLNGSENCSMVLLNHTDFSNLHCNFSLCACHPQAMGPSRVRTCPSLSSHGGSIVVQGSQVCRGIRITGEPRDAAGGCTPSQHIAPESKELLAELALLSVWGLTIAEKCFLSE